MPITPVSVGASNTEDDNSGTTSVVNFTSGFLENDILFAFINASNGTTNQNPAATHTWPAGWTEIVDISTDAATANGLCVAWHKASSDDEISSVTATAEFTTGYVSTGIIFRGQDLTTPIDVSAEGTATAAVNSNTTSDVLTTKANVLVCRLISLDNDTDTGVSPSPGGYAERFKMTEPGPGNATTSYWYDMVETSAGQTGTEVISWTGTAEESISFTFGIRPAAADGIDSAEKRKSISGINYFSPGVTPNSGQDQEWRQEAGYSYSGILALDPTPSTFNAFFAIRKPSIIGQGLR